MTRRDFIVGTAAAAVVSKTAVASDASGRGLSVRFLGTGAADWNGRDERGELRRLTSLLIEKDGVRLLYATDTGGIPADAARLAGIDVHRKGEGITALVMEATMGLGYDEDFRIYTHSSVESVIRTVHVLQKTGRYHPAAGQKVYLTHMARTLHGTHAEVAKALPDPIVPAYDGLDVRFLPPAE